jgi:hypothetical protein
MEEGQERDSLPDTQEHIIDDDDMEDSLTDSPDVRIPERNEELRKTPSLREYRWMIFRPRETHRQCRDIYIYIYIQYIYTYI